MEIVYLLIPLSVVLVAIAVIIFIWATNSGQFEDLDTPAWRILRDDESRKPDANAGNHRQPGPQEKDND